MDVYSLMREQELDDLAHIEECLRSKEFELNSNEFTLADVENAVQQRLDYLSKVDVGDIPLSEWLDWYNALVRVRQAQAMECIANLLDGFRINGLPIENVQ